MTFLGWRGGRSDHPTWVTVTSPAEYFFHLSFQCKQFPSLTTSRNNHLIQKVCSLETTSKYRSWNALTFLRLYCTYQMRFITIKYLGKTHTHTPQMAISSTVVSCCWTNECFSITPASCDWPAQDETDIVESIRLHRQCSAGSDTAVRKWWKENRRDRGVSSRISYSHKLYHMKRVV